MNINLISQRITQLCTTSPPEPSTPQSKEKSRNRNTTFFFIINYTNFKAIRQVKNY